jgi:drug/metabolite transporter (DMT)-like permease
LWWCRTFGEEAFVTWREIALVLLSALLHAVWNFSTKGSGSPVAFTLLRNAIAATGLIVLLPFFELREIPSQVWRILCGSVVVHTLYLYSLSKAYQSEDLSLVYPIARSTPAFVPLVAAPLLGERLSLLGAVGIAVVVVGIWLVNACSWRWRSLAQPGVKHALLALTATVAYSLLDKHAMATFSPSSWSGLAPRAVVYFLLMEAIVVVLFFPLALREVGGEGLCKVARLELRSAAGAGLAALASYTLILEAFRTASVSYVVAGRQSSVLFALALGMIFLRERPSRVRFVGTVATVVGVALISVA